jgi:hypothetical protein
LDRDTHTLQSSSSFIKSERKVPTGGYTAREQQALARWPKRNTCSSRALMFWFGGNLYTIRKFNGGNIWVVPRNGFW